MRVAPTPLAGSLLKLAGWALFLAVLSGRAELLLAAVPLLVAVLGARLDAGAHDCGVTHEVGATRVFEGDRLGIAATLAARAPLPLIEVSEACPPLAEVAAGHNRALFTMASGEEVRWRYELRCGGRSRLSLGRVRLRLWDRSGLRVTEWEAGTPAPVAVYPRIVPLRRVPRPRRTQTSVGNYVSPALGEGLEPGGIRPFAPGDRVRHVNWRASLRLGALHVTQYHRERNADVVLMLDTLAEAGAAGAGTLDACARAGASLASAYLGRKDRVGLIEYGGLVRWVRPGSGPAQYVRLLDALLEARVVFTYVAKALDLVPPRVLPPEALVIALSPLLDRRFVTAVTDLAARGFDLVVLAVCPIEPTRAAMGPSPVDDLACQVWSLERREQLDELRRGGLTVVEWRPSEPLEAAVAPLARRRPRLALA